MPLQQINVSPAEETKNDTFLENQNGIAEVRCESQMSCGGESSSGGSAGLEICRICHCEGDADAGLIAPCYCSGSLRYVHQICLQQWIKSSNTRCCELCRFQFIMHTKTKPFTEWEPLDMNGFERRKLLCAVMFHGIALTCVVWSLYVLIDRTAEEIKQGMLEWPFWTKLIVVAIGFTGGVVFMYIQCKAYMQICQRWKAYNRVIYVQNAPEKQPISISRVSTAQAQACRITPNEESGIGGITIQQPSTLSTNAPTSTVPPLHHSKQDEASIDLKGVTNVHIFFKDDNQSSGISGRAIEGVSVSDDICDNGGISCGVMDGVGGGGTANQTTRIDQDTASMWHIKIGKGVPNDSTASSLRCNELDNLMSCDGREEATGGVRANEQSTLGDSVLKLQIKKAEIVIQFGGQKTNNGGPGTNACCSSAVASTGADSLSEDLSSDTAKDTSVNIKIDDKESDPIVIDVVKKTVAPETEPVQIRFGFGETSQRMEDGQRLLDQSSDSPSQLDTYPRSGTDSGSQSPLLAHKNHD